MERQHEAAIANTKETVRDLQKELSDKSRALVKKSKELDDLRVSTRNQLELLERQHSTECAIHQRRAIEADRCVQDLETAGNVGHVRTQSTIEQLKDQHSSDVGQLEARLRNERDTVKHLGSKIR